MRDVSAAAAPTRTLQLQQDPETHPATCWVRRAREENAREDTGIFPLAVGGRLKSSEAHHSPAREPRSPIFDLRCPSIRAPSSR